MNSFLVSRSEGPVPAKLQFRLRPWSMMLSFFERDNPPSNVHIEKTSALRKDRKLVQVTDQTEKRAERKSPDAVT